MHGLARAGGHLVGNGTQFGLLQHCEVEWRTVQVSARVRMCRPGLELSAAMGAIGDSAVIECCGLNELAFICRRSDRHRNRLECRFAVDQIDELQHDAPLSIDRAQPVALATDEKSLLVKTVLGHDHR